MMCLYFVLVTGERYINSLPCTVLRRWRRCWRRRPGQLCIYQVRHTSCVHISVQAQRRLGELLARVHMLAVAVAYSHKLQLPYHRDSKQPVPAATTHLNLSLKLTLLSNSDTLLICCYHCVFSLPGLLCSSDGEVCGGKGECNGFSGCM
jgi:hypothetical protein